jgi:serine/threonine-protein kinase
MLLDGRYRIETKLAAGGFGAIYRATHVPSGMVVALKVLHADIASDPHLSARFRREAAALASLRHPHTITTFDHGQAADGTLFIAMELLTGRSLFEELHMNGPLTWRRLLGILSGVCTSLVEAHALGVVHRDLKPANIHLERRDGDNDYVKVLDFGIAKVLHGSDMDDGSELTRIGQAIGTLEYMSPEQIVGGEIDGRSDLYTLGVVAYEMLTGRRPFADATGPTSLMTALMTRAAVPPSVLHRRGSLPAELDRMILRLLACEPQDRFQSAAELAAEIDAILASDKPDFSPVTTLPGSGPIVPPRLPLPLPLPAPAPVAQAPAMAAAPRIPAPKPVSRPAVHTPPRGPVSLATIGSFEEDDDTTVDSRSLVEAAWEPDPIVPPPLARTPFLAEPPDMTGFEARAQGSTVGPVPEKPEPGPAARKLGVLEMIAWGAALLASGVGLGMLVSALT